MHGALYDVYFTRRPFLPSLALALSIMSVILIFYNFGNGGLALVTWPARPPAPWQQGMAPNQAPTRFMAPTLEATRTGRAGRRGNKSLDS